MGDIDASEVVERARRAIQETGTCYHAVLPPNAVGGKPTLPGEIEIGRGLRTQAGDGTNLTYFDGQKEYTLRPDGSWWVRMAIADSGNPLFGFLGSSTTQWELKGAENTQGRRNFAIARLVEKSRSSQRSQTFGIDAETFLPSKLTWEVEQNGTRCFGIEIAFSDFGAPVDVTPLAAALAQARAHKSSPDTSSDAVRIPMLNM